MFRNSQVVRNHTIDNLCSDFFTKTRKVLKEQTFVDVIYSSRAWRIRSQRSVRAQYNFLNQDGDHLGTQKVIDEKIDRLTNNSDLELKIISLLLLFTPPPSLNDDRTSIYVLPGGGPIFV
mmetsp:Transcript_40198/g.67356  ORF Transcript_40198/g.67356 Transcript_40198/m.67356 type:complete len:120 (-) Transcript_40198:259-618(-)